MESFKPISVSRCLAVLAIAGLLAPMAPGQSQSAAQITQTERNRRNVAIEEAQELLKKGDEAYTGARYAEAVEAYAGARELIPIAPISAELRDAATERLAQAAVEQAHFLSRNGDVPGAKAVVDKVLVESVAPNNPGALRMRAELDDPIRTNPALTPQHAKDMDAVRKLLYTAEGAYNLGKFKEAQARYEDVLRIDSTNTAARRGMEQTAVAVRDYYKSAYDQTRAQRLAEIDGQWEVPVPPASAVIPPTLEGDPATPEVASVKERLERLFISQISLDQVTLEEAVDFLRVKTGEIETGSDINFTVNLGAPNSPEAIRIRQTRFDLRLSNVPVSHILKYITAATRTTYSTDDFSVNIIPSGSSSVEMVVRTYRVPPDFISSLSVGATEAASTKDPFAQDAPKTGLLPTRLGAQEALMKQGVKFPEGASASYLPATNTLRVVNTAANQDFISQLVETITKTEPVTVSVQVTMIKVEENRLEELGFDWILDNIGFGGPSWVPGADILNLSGGTQGNGGNLGDIPLPPGSFTRNPITAGNRSGDTAFSSDSIDSLLTNQLGAQSVNRAPGIFGFRGQLGETSVQVLIRGLNQKKGVDLMGKPSVITRSGQSSSIAFVREFPYATEYEPPELPNSTVANGGSTPVTPANPSAFDMREIGVKMDVLPVVDPDKRFVNVTLNPTFTDFDGFVNYGSAINTTSTDSFGREQVSTLTGNAILMPIFSVHSVSTSVDVVDGGTVVLGGLRKETTQRIEDKTPIFGDIPLIGTLFQSKGHKTISTAVIFLVHVELMDPTGRGYRDR